MDGTRQEVIYGNTINSERDCYYDNLKFFLMILVVIAHFGLPSVIFDYIYLFHMPLFIFVSGKFHKNENIKSRIFFLLITAIILNCFIYTLDRYVLNEYEEFYLFSPRVIPWYLICIAICTMVTFYLQKIDQMTILFTALFVGAFVGYDSVICKFGVIAKFFVFFPFYYLGYMYGKKVSNFMKRKMVKYIFGGVFVALFLLAYYFRNTYFSIYNFFDLFIAYIPYDKIPYAGNFLYRLAYYFFALVVGFGFCCLVPRRKLGYITIWGRRTIQVLFWHIPIRDILLYLEIDRYIGNYYIGRLIYIMIGLVITCVLSTKLFSFPTSIIKGRTEINN